MGLKARLNPALSPCTLKSAVPQSLLPIPPPYTQRNDPSMSLQALRLSRQSYCHFATHWAAAVTVDPGNQSSEGRGPSTKAVSKQEVEAGAPLSAKEVLKASQF